MGTGLPQPNPIKRNMKLPKGSRCFIGFRESRPEIFAVLSPNLKAIKAWPNSCTDKAHSKARIKAKSITGNAIRVSAEVSRENIW